MKKMTIGLSGAALALAGVAYAQPGMHAKGDANGDGVVSRAEAKTHAAQMFGWMDANDDGKLDQTDRKARKTERRTKMFEALDADNNGQISRDEFMAFEHDGKHGERGHWGHKRGHRGSKMMMKMADSDNNGAVSQAEFTDAAMQRFDRTDTNNDGQVTKEERQAARAAMRDHWRQGKGPNAPGS